MFAAPHSKFPAQTIHPMATVSEAARLMREQGASALVVVDPSTSAPLYTVTDRDFVYVIADGVDAKTTTLAQLAENPIVCGTAECWFG